MGTYKEELILRVAEELAKSHGALFAAAFLADHPVALHKAVLSLTPSKRISSQVSDSQQGDRTGDNW